MLSCACRAAHPVSRPSGGSGTIGRRHRPAQTGPSRTGATTWRRLTPIARPHGHAPGFEARRAEIIDTAARLMADRGYRAVSMADLGDAVGLGKGPLYHYIGSKEKVLVAIQARVLEPLLETTRPIIGLDADPLVRLRLTSRALLTVMLGRLEYVRVYEHDHRNLHGESRAALVRQRAEFEGLVRGLIEEAVKQRKFRRVDAHLAMLQFLNLHNRTYEWYDEGGPWDAAFLSREYCRTLFGGLCTSSYDEPVLEREVKRLWADLPTAEPPRGPGAPTD